MVEAVERELSWVEESTTEDGRRLFRTRLPERYVFFEGHFPAHPILAGATQLTELVLPCARRLGALGPVRGVGQVKFMSRLAPGDDVEVGLDPPRRAPDGSLTVAFRIHSGKRRCTVGRVEFAGTGLDAS
jgi:3-hydroxymyristoyl/3-hydroxydecanoyl-(acyl carrier protein) dehydratase